jgi:hypothetical protein
MRYNYLLILIIFITAIILFGVYYTRREDIQEGAKFRARNINLRNARKYATKGANLAAKYAKKGANLAMKYANQYVINPAKSRREIALEEIIKKLITTSTAKPK